MAMLFADEDISLVVVNRLAQLGHDIVSANDLRRKGLPDPDQLKFASAQGRAVVTHNRLHFLRLHRHAKPHAGIIICTRDDADPEGLADRIHAAIGSVTTLVDQLLRVYRLP
jgi:hypothetical protein